MASGALSGLRVLDLTDYRGALCGRLLADMGAEVIKIEPPAGDPGRAVGPFLGGMPHADRSLFFWFYNLNKFSVTLDIRRPSGAEMLMRLAESADVIIENFRPGELEAFNLGWERLHKTNPALILCSIAPFGQSGPYRDFYADDTVLSALGGMLYVNGFPDDAPVRPLGLQAYHSGSYFAAIAIMCGLFARDRDATGQWLDVSIQEATCCAVEHVVGSYFATGVTERRRGTLHWSRFFDVGKCRDGYVLECTLGDWTSLAEWVGGDGKAQDLGGAAWNEAGYRRDHAEHLFEVLSAWVRDYTCDELLERAQTLRLPFASVRAPAALLGDEQLAARSFFVEVEHPELARKILYPGAPYKFGVTPWQVYRRPPLLGEHTGEVLSRELGLDPAELAILRAEGLM